jgi:Tfp pilus assembly protein PilP
MSRMRGLLAVSLVLALAGVGCHKQSVGPKVSDYQKQRDAAIAKAKALATQPQKFVATTKAGQQGQQPQQPQDANAPTFGGDVHGYVYSPVGKRDPFRSFILERKAEADASVKGPLEQFDLGQLSLTGVVWKGQRRRALVLDPSGQAYIVAEGDRIGKNEGRVVQIGDDLMVVRESYVDFQGEKTTKEIEMRVRQSQGG